MKISIIPFFLPITLLTTPLLSGCGEGFKAGETTASCASASCTNSNNSNGSNGAGDSNNTGAGGSSSGTPDWQTLKVEGSVSGGRFGKTRVVDIDKAKKELIVRLPMLASPFLDLSIAPIPLPRIPGAQLSLEPLPDEASALVLRIPLSVVLHGVDFLSPSRLPNGDPLPAIPGGELPALAVQLTKVKDIRATIYLAKTLVGIYVNTPIDPFVQATLPIRNEARTRILGYFSTIPAKPKAADGGFFISVALPEDLVRIIDDNL